MFLLVSVLTEFFYLGIWFFWCCWWQ